MTLAVPLFLTIVLVLGFAFVRTRLQVSRMTRLGQLSWEDLLSKLEPVPIHEIAMIAHEYLEPKKGNRNLMPTNSGQ